MYVRGFVYFFGGNKRNHQSLANTTCTLYLSSTNFFWVFRAIEYPTTHFGTLFRGPSTAKSGFLKDHRALVAPRNDLEAVHCPPLFWHALRHTRETRVSFHPAPRPKREHASVASQHTLCSKRQQEVSASNKYYTQNTQMIILKEKKRTRFFAHVRVQQ